MLKKRKWWFDFAEWGVMLDGNMSDPQVYGPNCLQILGNSHNHVQFVIFGAFIWPEAKCQKSADHVFACQWC